MTADYHAAIEGAALFDRSTAGKLELTGDEAPQFLHNLSTNDINNLPLGGGCEAFFCDSRAKVLAFARIYHILRDGEHALWIDTDPGRGDELSRHLDKHLIAERAVIENRTADFAQLHLAGPLARTVLEKALGEPLPDLATHQHMERTLGRESTCHLRRHGPLGVPGYDLVCLPERVAAVRRLLKAFGAVDATPEVYDLLRIEAGTPVYGRDLDASRFVVEVGRVEAISFTKGCYLGQEPIVMARDRAGFVNRSFRGLRFADRVGQPGDKLFDAADKEVGLVTSVAESPRFGAIGLGYLKRGSEVAGTSVRLAEGRAATVAGLPLRAAPGA